MAELKLGDEFTPTGEGTVEAVQEVKETPAEAPAAEKPVVVADAKQDVDVSELERKQAGLQQEVGKLLEEVKHLRGTKRELKQEQIVVAQKELDDLKDVNPADAQLIERVLRSKGYVSKGEASQMFYDAVKDQQVATFCDKYPEYSKQNDPNDLNWSALERVMADYRKPDNPHDVYRLMEQAHKIITASRTVNDQNIPAKKRAVETASAGAGGVQRSSASKSFDPAKRRAYEEGGWTEDEIKALESKLK